MKIRFFGKRTF